jgi:hypothetical protein
VQTATSQNNSASSATAGGSGGGGWGSNVTHNNAVVVMVFATGNSGAVNITNVTDDNGNTYTVTQTVSKQEAGGGNYMAAAIWYCGSVVGGAKLTVTVTVAHSSSLSIALLEVNPALTNDVQNTDFNTTAAATTNPDTGAVTTNHANELSCIVCALGTGSTLSSWTEPSGYTSQLQGVGGLAGFGPGDAATQLFSSTQSGHNPTWTDSTASSFVGIITTFYAGTPITWVDTESDPPGGSNGDGSAQVIHDPSSFTQNKLPPPYYGVVLDDETSAQLKNFSLEQEEGISYTMVVRW